MLPQKMLTQYTWSLIVEQDEIDELQILGGGTNKGNNAANKQCARTRDDDSLCGPRDLSISAGSAMTLTQVPLDGVDLLELQIMFVLKQGVGINLVRIPASRWIENF